MDQLELPREQLEQGKAHYEPLEYKNVMKIKLSLNAFTQETIYLKQGKENM